MCSLCLGFLTGGQPWHLFLGHQPAVIMNVQAWYCVRSNGGRQVNLDMACVSCADGTGRLKAASSFPHGPGFRPLLTQSQVEGWSIGDAGKLCELRIASQHSHEQAAPLPGVGSTSRAWNFTARGAWLAPSQTQVKAGISWKLTNWYTLPESSTELGCA